MLIAPIAYQGGKGRLAARIVKLLLRNKANVYCDLCCGSGAISIEFINQGVKPDQLIMLDNGPWGKFWYLVGQGRFDLAKFEDWIHKVPKEPDKIKVFLEDLAKQSVGPLEDAIYVFLLLQAGSFGSKPIWWKNGRWCNTSFRSYWQPTATSNRRSPVNPMMPMPQTLLERVKNICQTMKGVTAIHDDITLFTPPLDSIVYIDPPYQNTTKYGSDFEVCSYAQRITAKTYVSEAKALSQFALRLATAEQRKQGGISGNKKRNPNEEWLSVFNTPAVEEQDLLN